MKRHAPTHTGGERPHKCNQCEWSFNYIRDMKVHKIRKHSGDERPHKCDQCEKSFVYVGDLRRHKLRMHTDERPHKCEREHCGKQYMTRYDLKEHVRVHTGERPHKCDQCEKYFTYVGDLKTHKLRMHTGERPHKCDHSSVTDVKSLLPKGPASVDIVGECT